MHNREDEIVAQEAKCTNTPDMFAPDAGTYTADAIRCVDCDRKLLDKCITDDFYKQIDQREEAIPDD